MQKHHGMRKLFCVLLSACLSFASLAQTEHVDTLILPSETVQQMSKSPEVLGTLNRMDSYWENVLDNTELDGEKISVTSTIKSAKINYWLMVIAIVSALIALGGAVVTCGTFIEQHKVGKRQVIDNRRERYESRLFGYLEQYRGNVSSFSFNVIGSGRPVFNYIFYEYQTLYLDFYQMGYKAPDGSPLDKETISSIAVSMVINGITSNSDGGSMDLIYDKYRDLVTMEVYESMKGIIDGYKNMSDDVLKEKLENNPRTLFINYGKLQLSGERVPWFYGCRSYFMPYVRTVACLLDLMADARNDKALCNQDDDFRIVSSVIGDHELAVLHAFADSRDNNVGLNKDMIDRFIEVSHMPDLYNYKKW